MTDEQPLENRFALFFDFLGSSNAARIWPRERIHQFVDLLILISHVESAEAMSGEAQSDGSYRLRVVPEVTTFSDNVVVSYRGVPDEQAGKMLDSVWAEIVCKDSARILSGVAEMALRIGLLMRGGLSFGQLYHEGRVVFGEAMVDAYELEQKAEFPRVIVSDRVIRKLTHVRPEDMPALLRDTDDKWHLNYIPGMMRHSVDPGPHAHDAAARWKRAHLDLIIRTIDDLRQAGAPTAPRRIGKWEWFKERFEASTSCVPA